MTKQIIINYNPDEPSSLCADNQIPSSVDFMMGLFESSEKSLEFHVSQWNYINEFLFRFMNGELSQEELVFMYKGLKIGYDSLGYFVNEPESFRSPAHGVVQKINNIRLNKL